MLNIYFIDFHQLPSQPSTFNRSLSASVQKSKLGNIRKEISRHWTFFSKDNLNNSVNEKWLRLKSILIDCLNKFVPTKLTSKRQNLPWLNKSLRKAIRRKARLYNTAKTLERLTFEQNINYRNGTCRRARWSCPLVLY